MDQTASTITKKENAIFVQHDWEKSLREKDQSSIFVGVRKFNEKSQFYDFIRKKDVFECDQPGISIEALTAKTLKVVRDGLAEKTFVAPWIQFHGVHSASTNTVDVSCTGRLVASGDANGTILVWNADTGEQLRNLEGHISSFDVNKLRFFPSGLVLLSAGMDMSVRIWSVETGECARSLKGHTQSVLDVGIIGKGQEVMSCSKDGTVKKWNCGSGQLMQNWPLELGIVNSVSVDTDSKMFAAATENKTLVIQDLDSDQPISRFVVDSSCTSVTIANGHCFAGTSTGDIYAFDLKNGSIENVLKTNRGRVTALKWSKLGLVAAFGDGTLTTYTDHLDPGEYDFSGADCDPINDFAVTDKVLISVCRDKVVRKYDVASL